ncbi:MAG: HEPN domain-containing protein [Verrucomicrobia bacterium]|nr:HEPN domain-containing protein [Verrucomicrobiota bacterium]
MADPAASEAKAWMVKAWRDLETARRAAAGQPPFYDVAVYHCQQAAEKAVKAFLVHHGKPYEKTHDIEGHHVNVLGIVPKDRADEWLARYGEEL